MDGNHDGFQDEEGRGIARIPAGGRQSGCGRWMTRKRGMTRRSSRGNGGGLYGGGAPS